MHKSAYNKSDNYNELGIKIYTFSKCSNKCVILETGVEILIIGLKLGLLKFY